MLAREAGQQDLPAVGVGLEGMGAGTYPRQAGALGGQAVDSRPAQPGQPYGTVAVVTELEVEWPGPGAGRGPDGGLVEVVGGGQPVGPTAEQDGQVGGGERGQPAQLLVASRDLGGALVAAVDLVERHAPAAGEDAVQPEQARHAAGVPQMLADAYGGVHEVGGGLRRPWP
ncbi:hypothetical protein [Streptomyces sp. NPDC048277]|uniref:hypothetical protein n=1 Tax=Streptomyces sp. NPDC048277 TaxID=3155027 RepID=UPI0033F1EF4B